MTSRRKDYIFEPFKVTEVKYRGFESPRPRSGHRIASDDANIYCFGGYNPSLPLTNIQLENPTWTPARPLFKELWSFSIASRKWKQHRVIENMPEELASNAMCMNGRYLMVCIINRAEFLSVTNFIVTMFVVIDIWRDRCTLWQQM